MPEHKPRKMLPFGFYFGMLIALFGCGGWYTVIEHNPPSEAAMYLYITIGGGIFAILSLIFRIDMDPPPMDRD